MSKSKLKPLPAAEHSHGYEFGGPIGAFATSFGLPIVTYLVAFACNDLSGCPVPSALHPSTLTLDNLKKETGWPGFSGLLSLEVTGWVLAYYFLSLLLQAFLPGEEKQGLVLSSGGRLNYKFNAFNSAILTAGAAVALTSVPGLNFPLWDYIWDNYVQLITANLLIAFSLACFVYVRSFSVKPENLEYRELAPGGHSGNLVYDWFIGRELNPRIVLPLLGEIDIKLWCELRPGMLGWVLLNFAFLYHQYKLYGIVSDSMILVVGTQALYVFDALWMEPAILSTMDIISDGFGFMLAFGDLAWLPFIYSLQARYLAVYPVHLGLTGIAGVLAVQGFGYYIFRASNNEKNRFRTNPTDPKIAHLKFIETKSGSKLLVSGWWGTARHINYLGDWIMSWSYCLPTGFAGYLVASRSPFVVVQGEAAGWGMAITYFYVVYFAILLIHRERRDEEKCKRKYGADWEVYKKKVPYRMIPYIY